MSEEALRLTNLINKLETFLDIRTFRDGSLNTEFTDKESKKQLIDELTKIVRQ